MLCLMGDLNAQNSEMKIRGVGDDFSVEVVNEIGELMLEMCLQNEVAVCTTFFFQEVRNTEDDTVLRKVRRETVVNREKVQICVSSRVKAWTLNGLKLRGAWDVRSDHHLVAG